MKVERGKTDKKITALLKARLYRILNGLVEIIQHQPLQKLL